MAKKVSHRLLYRDCPGDSAWIDLGRIDPFDRTRALLDAIWEADASGEAYIAAAFIRGALPLGKMRPETARLILRAIEVADGVRTAGLERWEMLLATLIVRKPLNGRAVLYYDCCSCLGFDPAEDYDPAGAG